MSQFRHRVEDRIENMWENVNNVREKLAGRKRNKTQHPATEMIEMEGVEGQGSTSQRIENWIQTNNEPRQRNEKMGQRLSKYGESSSSSVSTEVTPSFQTTGHISSHTNLSQKNQMIVSTEVLPTLEQLEPSASCGMALIDT